MSSKTPQNSQKTASPAQIWLKPKPFFFLYQFLGNYERTIQNALRASGLQFDDRSRVLFQCLDHGAIELYVRCPYVCRRLPEDAPGYDWGDDYC
ncbi:hypothetical protein EMPG_10401 [Blastomyces silverae]|uniref:Uncharacterized protein n=1 Tax=Blastomyces silverae TaxID=2060906 RepID=A0A0H1B593_9EURO|nr:hypothetical protein EMPG_10401 [Blastomyces silverae]